MKRRTPEQVRRDLLAVAERLDPTGGEPTMVALLIVAGLYDIEAMRIQTARRLRRLGFGPDDLFAFLYTRVGACGYRAGQLATALRDPACIPRTERLARARGLEQHGLGKADPGMVARVMEVVRRSVNGLQEQQDQRS